MSKGKQPPKKKKEKIVYIDDGSTVADMSGVGRKPLGQPPRPVHSGRQKPRPTTRAGSVWETYKAAVRSMIGPMLVTLGGITVVFALLWIILGFFA